PGGPPAPILELYDPAAARFIAGPPLLYPRERHTATRLASGAVLLAGGHGAGNVLVAEIYDPTPSSADGGAGSPGDAGVNLPPDLAVSCTPGSFLRCVGGSLITCNASGDGEVTTACSNGCNTAAGR